MSMEWIRNTYHVPCKKGGRIIYTGGLEPQGETIKSASDGRLNILLDGYKKPMLFHPRWEIEYVEQNKDQP